MSPMYPCHLPLSLVTRKTPKSGRKSGGWQILVAVWSLGFFTVGVSVRFYAAIHTVELLIQCRSDENCYQEHTSTVRPKYHSHSC